MVDVWRSGSLAAAWRPPALSLRTIERLVNVVEAARQQAAISVALGAALNGVRLSRSRLQGGVAAPGARLISRESAEASSAHVVATEADRTCP